MFHTAEYMRVIRSVLVLVIILLPFPTLSAVRKQKYGEEAFRQDPYSKFLLNLWVKRRRLVSFKQDLRDMAQDVHIKLSLLVPKICDAKNQDTYYNAFIDGSTQW